MKQAREDPYFVQVKNPNDVRRSILHTLKDIVDVLRRFEKFKHIRQEKEQNIQKLRVLLKESNKMLGNLKLRMPQTSLKATDLKDHLHIERAPHKKAKADKAPKDKEVEEPKKSMTNIEVLEAQLGAIEDKLKGLS